MTKLLRHFLPLVFAMILMPGLGGCANDRASSKSTPTTCPAAKSVCETDEAPVVDEEDLTVTEENRPALTRELDSQVHNAELDDMSVADIHFLPHRPGLNTTGTQRLSHLAWLVDRYGGTISLDLEAPKSDLAKARREAVIRYLRDCGLPQSKIHVTMDLPQAKGMDAKEAIKVHNDTRYKSKQAGQSTSFGDLAGADSSAK